MLKSIMDTAARILALSVGLACVLVAALIVYEIVGRTFFGTSIIWVEEVVSYLVGYVAFVGAAAALQQDGHVGVDLLVSRARGRGFMIVRMVAEGIVTATLALLAYLAILFWLDAFETGERAPSLLGTQLWIPYLSFAIGMTLLFLVQLVRFWRHCAGPLFQTRQTTPEAAVNEALS